MVVAVFTITLYLAVANDAASGFNDLPLYLRIAGYFTATVSILGSVAVGWNKVIGPFVAKPIVKVFFQNADEYLDKKMGPVNADVATLKSDVSQMRTQITEIKTTLSDMKQKDDRRVSEYVEGARSTGGSGSGGFPAGPVRRGS